MTNPIASSFSDTKVCFARSWDDIQEAMRWLDQRRDILALDTETSGLNPWDANSRIRLFQMGDVNSAWAFDTQLWAGVMKHVLENYQHRMTWHNVEFDAKWILVKYPDIRFPWSRTDDTMIMARLHDNEATAALKPIGTQLYGTKASVGQMFLQSAMETNKWNWDTVPLEFAPYSQYAAIDTILGARVWRHYENVHSGEFRRVYELEMETRRICNQAEIRGMRVDMQYVDEKSTSLDEYVLKLKTYCKSTYDVSIGSAMQLGRWFTENGAKLDATTSTGQPAMDKFVLQRLAGEGYELAQMALDARRADKLNGTYLKNFRRFVNNDPNDILHPQINTIQARTGRMSITDPALQTLPKEDKVIRRAFLPHEGESLVSADYAQIEMRLTAHLSADAALIEAFEIADDTGDDFFTVIGKRIYGPEFIKSDPRRRLVKNVMYASAYGAGVPKMALSAGVTLEVMTPVAESLFTAFPGIKRIQSIAITQAELNKREHGRPFINTASGRRLYINPDKIYTASNYLVQSTAAEVLKQAIVNLDMMGLGDYFLIPVHDECIFSVPTDAVDDVKLVIKEAMEVTKEMGYALKIPAEPEGPFGRWGGE